MRYRIDSFAPPVSDSIQWIHGIAMDVGLGLDLSRGAVR